MSNPNGTGPMKTVDSVEADQERLLRAKYGGLLPKKKVGPRDQRYFDSADWQLQKQSGKGATGAGNLAPKLRPTPSDELEVAGRRASQLSD